MNFPAVAISLVSLSVTSRTGSAFRSASASICPRSHGTRINRLRHFRSASTLPLRQGDDRTTMEPPSRGSIYWNREDGKSSGGHASFHNGPIVKEARIFALCDPNDANNEPLCSGPLPDGCTLLGVGSSLADFLREDGSISGREPNVIFVSHPRSRETLLELLDEFPSVEWIHTRSAGVDHIMSDGLSRSTVHLTNAKGMFSSTLAEYCMMACSYFAKDLPRLMRQKNDVDWTQYPISELRGATLGIVGYGDIGRACARLAKAYGMVVLGLKRTASSSSADPYCDRVYGAGGLHEMLSKSDYVLVSAPLTEQTRGLISKEALSNCKPSAVLINVGRGPIVDEGALVEALTNGTIGGAGLDVTTVEPLPRKSPLWKLDNVLLSPHNMDMTRTFMRESTEFFVNENLPRFVRGKTLLNPVDKSVGY